MLGTTVGGPSLLTTADEGSSWTRLALPKGLSSLGDAGPGTAVAFSDAERGLLAAGGSFWATGDGGHSWRTGGPANAEVRQIAAGPNAGYVLLRTANGGYVLGRAAAGTVEAKPVLDGNRLTGTTPYLATSGTTVVVISGDRTLRSSDGGRSFTASRGPCRADLGGTVSAAGSAVLAWCATGTAGVGYLSTDRGAGFTRTDASGGNHAAGAPTGSGAVFAYQTGSGLRLTGRSGAGTAVRGGPSTVSWVGFSTPDNGFAIGATDSGSTRLWRSVDGGHSWSPLGRG